MPIPTPSGPKTPTAKRAFIQRCMSDEVMRREFPEQDRRAAVCLRQWSDHKAKAAYVVRAGDDEYAFIKDDETSIPLSFVKPGQPKQEQPPTAV